MNDGNTKKLKRIITHSGSFHTDEVFACAVLWILYDGMVEVVRSRDPVVWGMADYLVDVGGVYNETIGRFDHHQIGGAGVRRNGIPYSSFGLVWKYCGEKVAGSAYAARMIDERMVQPIDAGDNGVQTFSTNGDISPYLIQNAVNAFRPGWDEIRDSREAVDKSFFDILKFAKRLLRREIVRLHGEEEGTRRTEQAYQDAEDKRIIILDDRYSWYGALCAHSEPLFVIKPSSDGRSWKVEAVRDSMSGFKNKKNLPEAWAGKRDDELARISGVPDAIFCHKERFVAKAGSKDGAIQLAQRALLDL